MIPAMGGLRSRFHSNRRRTVVLAAGLSVAAVAGCSSGSSDAAETAGKLDGTVWCAPEQHERLSVDWQGEVATKAGKDVCLSFARRSQHYIVTVTWWNVVNRVHVQEWAVASQAGPTRMYYTEARQPGEQDFPGIEGFGEIDIISEDRMKLHQFGFLADGESAVFDTTLARVPSLPEIPIPRTYPAP